MLKTLNSAPQILRFPEKTPYQLLISVDAEEEFDWTQFSSAHNSVRNMAQQYLAQRVFEKFGCIPTYLVDYPVAAQPDGYRPLCEFLQDGNCVIGSQLHPWVTPPLEQGSTQLYQTFAGNLKPAMERAKLATLTEMIQTNFGVKPLVYRAGRYGTGPHTAKILAELGYRIDTSVLPEMDFTAIGGPTYEGVDVHPYWLDRPGGVLEIPLTSGYTGLLSAWGQGLYPLIDSPASRAARIPGVLARLHLLNRARLSPEGQTLREAIAITREFIARGIRIFVVSYHSSSLLPGSNPYVSSTAEMNKLLDWLSGYLEFFLGALGGKPITPNDAYAQAVALRGLDPVGEI